MTSDRPNPEMQNNKIPQICKLERIFESIFIEFYLQFIINFIELVLAINPIQGGLLLLRVLSPRSPKLFFLN